MKVNLVNQIEYAQTFTKYKAGLASGDLPDVVQLQETEQQQMIDTQTVLPASVCAKADKYSFSDFLPRIISYFTVEGTQYAMPFNNSGPVLFYNKKAFTAAGLDPEKPPTTFDEVRAAAEKLKANGVEAPLGLKTEPGYFEHWRAMANKLYVNNSNGRKAAPPRRCTRTPPAGEIFSWLSGMVKDGLATTNPDLGQQLRQPARHPERIARDGVRHQRGARHHHRGPRRRATTRTSSSASRRCPGPGHKGGGVLVQRRRAVHGEQVGAGEAGGGVEVPEVPRRAREHDHVGDRYRLPPDPQGVGRQPEMQQLLGAEPHVQGRVRPAARAGRPTSRPRGR